MIFILRENTSLSQQLEEVIIQLRAQEMREMEFNVSNTEPSSDTIMEAELEHELEKRKQVCAFIKCLFQEIGKWGIDY